VATAVARQDLVGAMPDRKVPEMATDSLDQSGPVFVGPDRIFLGCDCNAFYISRAQHLGEIDGPVTTRDQFTLTLVTPERAFHFFNREVGGRDLIEFRDFVDAALETRSEASPSVYADSATADYGLELVESRDSVADLHVTIRVELGGFKCEEASFCVTHDVLREARSVLDRWLFEEIYVPRNLLHLTEL